MNIYSCSYYGDMLFAAAAAAAAAIVLVVVLVVIIWQLWIGYVVLTF